MLFLPPCIIAEIDRNRPRYENHVAKTIDGQPTGDTKAADLRGLTNQGIKKVRTRRSRAWAFRIHNVTAFTQHRRDCLAMYRLTFISDLVLEPASCGYELLVSDCGLLRTHNSAEEESILA